MSSSFIHRAHLVKPLEGPPPSDAWIGAHSNTADQTTYTFSAVDLGTPHSTRVIILGIVRTSSSSRTISSVTINGVSATLINNANVGNYGTIAIASVPSGSTGDIVVTFSGSVNNCAIGKWAYYSLADNTAENTDTTATNADPDFTWSNNVVNNRKVFCSFWLQTSTYSGISGATSRAGANTDSFGAYRFADYKATGTETPHDIVLTSTGSSSSPTGITAAFD